jgi:TRAP-type C4-dicarboxylate transport system permease large subunit
VAVFSCAICILLTPMAQAFDIHPIHPGIIFPTHLEIGASLPPLGINLFIASIRFSRPVLNLYAASIPFILILLSALAIITYIPWLSLALLE